MVLHPMPTREGSLVIDPKLDPLLFGVANSNGIITLYLSAKVVSTR